MWSNKEAPRSADDLSERLPKDLGISINPSSFLMMMIIFENVYEPFYDSSGLDLFYRQETPARPVRQAKR